MVSVRELLAPVPTTPGLAVHPRDQIWLRRLEGEIEMISHDEVRVHSHTEFSTRFARDAGKRTAGASRGEDVVP